MNPSTLIPLKTRDEVEIEQLMMAIQAKRDEITEMTLALENLKHEVYRFERGYNARIAEFYFELDKAELETKEYRLRLRLLQEGVSHTELEMRVESCFRSERNRLADYENEIGVEDEKSGEMEKKQTLPKDQLKQLRTLYLKLAKVYHPDKANHGEQQNKRKQIMTLINHAYENQDLQTLQRMHVGEILQDEFAEEIPRERKRRLMQEMNRLMRAIGELRLEINHTKSSRIFQLKQEVEKARENGIDLLANLARDLQRKINTSRHRLADLVNVFHRLREKFTRREKKTPSVSPGARPV